MASIPSPPPSPKEHGELDLSEILFDTTGDIPNEWGDDGDCTIMVSAQDLIGLSGIVSKQAKSPFGNPLKAYSTSRKFSNLPPVIPDVDEEDEDEDEVATIIEPPSHYRRPPPNLSAPQKLADSPNTHLKSPNVHPKSPKIVDTRPSPAPTSLHLSPQKTSFGLGPLPFVLGAIVVGALWLFLG